MKLHPDEFHRLGWTYKEESIKRVGPGPDKETRIKVIFTLDAFNSPTSQSRPITVDQSVEEGVVTSLNFGSLQNQTLIIISLFEKVKPFNLLVALPPNF